MKSEQEIISDLKMLGVRKMFLKAKKADIDPHLWKKVEGFFGCTSYYIYGAVGVGKTHLIVALMREAVVNDVEREVKDDKGTVIGLYVPKYPILVSVPDLLLEIRESFREGVEKSEKEIIDIYSDGKLMLDDLGVEKTTEWTLQTLYAIIDHRYRDMKQTVITSNLSLSKIADKVGDRIASRIAEMCKVIEIKGDDRRIQK